MKAKNSANASYTWKSILKGRDVIKRGAAWRIGSGLSVNVCGENWLPIKHNPRIITPVVIGWEGTADPALFSLVLWNLWNRRNNLRLGKPTLPLDKVLEHSQERQLESHSSPITSTNQRRTQIAPWTSPQDNRYKINFEGATFADDRSAGLRAVIRNKEGRVMAALSQKIPLPMLVIKVEVLAARRALELAVELGFDHIILEGDSEILHKALLVEGRNFTPYGHLVQDVVYFSSFLSAFKTSLVRRSGNKLAHSLARNSKSLNYMQIWMEDVPTDLLLIVQADLTSLP
ncbi:uncharacterized protein LOC142635076 [Castanea sativa]|uniref:uncharacterized protein LOC142635076 n=1 Tax=Castanea sativa TaxID=21020 RepID=UPI003F651001